MSERFHLQAGDKGTLARKDRHQCSLLIIDSEKEKGEQLQRTLKELGFSRSIIATSHSNGLDKLSQRPFTHVIFDARETDIEALEFLSKAIVLEQGIIAIASSYDPTLDNVFDLLIAGARSYLVKPFTSDDVDNVVVFATIGDPFPDFIRQCTDRNKVFATMASQALDDLSDQIRYAARYESAKKRLLHYKLRMENAVRMGQTFSIGAHEGFQEALIEQLIECASHPATALGRRRRVLQKQREGKGGAEPIED